MKHLFQFTALLAGLFILTGLTGCAKNSANHSPEAEVTTALPLLLSEEGGNAVTEPLETGHAAKETLETGYAAEETPETVGSYKPGSMVPCTNGLLVYYNQSDPRWGDQLYGSSDYMRTHGCGPTAVAMVVSSFTTAETTPLDVARWASDNGYCSSGEGSLHALIPDGLAYYGLPVRSLEDRSAESVLTEIRLGNIIVVLMNRGYFTESGHFLLLTQVTEDGKLRIADPASWENTQETWNVDFILEQARKKSDAGGPFWVVSLPEED